LKAIRNRGFNPAFVLDVGAYWGDWSAMIREIWPQTDIVMIEPNPMQTVKLAMRAAELNATMHTYLVGAENGKQVEFQMMATGSSVFPEYSDVERKSVTRTLRTLDSIFDPRPCLGMGLIKIDAQGYELEILKGADRILQHVTAVILEVALIEVNQGCPLLHEVVAWMHARGFVAYDVIELHRRPLDNALAQMDIFFVREDARLRSDRRFC
jgi:FkbM family methyltransferase